MDSSIARAIWRLIEPFHAVVYFASEAKRTYADIGLKGGWMGYFASRSAALGPVPPETVIATFYNFHSAMVRRALPDAWALASPETVLAARLRVARAGLGACLDASDPSVREAVATARDLLWHLLGRCDLGARPLFAAHVGLDRPDDPVLDLWLACTCWREYRGDGHVATLLANDVDGCEANVLAVASGRAPADQRRLRGWPEEEWGWAFDRLGKRGLLDGHGVITDEGRALEDSIERRTDELSAGPLLDDPERAGMLVTSMPALTEAVFASGLIPAPNPMGLSR